MLYSGFNILPRSVFWSASFNGRSDNLDVMSLPPSPTSLAQSPFHLLSYANASFHARGCASVAAAVLPTVASFATDIAIASMSYAQDAIRAPGLLKTTTSMTSWAAPFMFFWVQPMANLDCHSTWPPLGHGLSVPPRVNWPCFGYVQCAAGRLENLPNKKRTHRDCLV